MKTKVLVVDDHVLVRIGTIEAIESDGDIEVVAELSSGEGVVETYRKHVPDVVVMDFRMPGKDGAEATKDLVEQFPEAKVLMLSVYDGEEDVWKAMDAGAMGYLLKAADTESLIEAIETLAQGEKYVPAHLAQKLNKRDGRRHLTERELQVLALVVDGFSNKEIADNLTISLATVKLQGNRF